jgi:hypothetical protein
MLWALNEVRVKWRAAAGNIFVISFHRRRADARKYHEIFTELSIIALAEQATVAV